MLSGSGDLSPAGSPTRVVCVASGWAWGRGFKEQRGEGGIGGYLGVGVEELCGESDGGMGEEGRGDVSGD